MTDDCLQAAERIASRLRAGDTGKLPHVPLDGLEHTGRALARALNLSLDAQRSSVRREESLRGSLGRLVGLYNEHLRAQAASSLSRPKGTFGGAFGARSCATGPPLLGRPCRLSSWLRPHI